VQSGGGGPVRLRTVSGSIDVELPAGVRPRVRVAGRGKVKRGCEEGDDVEIDVKTMSGSIGIGTR
jgi:DUF4097 and DUF4098 domain-containing protein YvlB